MERYVLGEQDRMTLRRIANQLGLSISGDMPERAVAPLSTIGRATATLAYNATGSFDLLGGNPLAPTGAFRMAKNLCELDIQEGTDATLTWTVAENTSGFWRAEPCRITSDGDEAASHDCVCNLINILEANSTLSASEASDARAACSCSTAIPCASNLPGTTPSTIIVNLSGAVATVGTGPTPFFPVSEWEKCRDWFNQEPYHILTQLDELEGGPCIWRTTSAIPVMNYLGGTEYIQCSIEYLALTDAVTVATYARHVQVTQSEHAWSEATAIPYDGLAARVFDDFLDEGGAHDANDGGVTFNGATFTTSPVL